MARGDRNKRRTRWYNLAHGLKKEKKGVSGVVKTDASVASRQGNNVCNLSLSHKKGKGVKRVNKHRPTLHRPSLGEKKKEEGRTRLGASQAIDKSGGKGDAGAPVRTNHPVICKRSIRSGERNKGRRSSGSNSPQKKKNPPRGGLGGGGGRGGSSKIPSPVPEEKRGGGVFGLLVPLMSPLRGRKERKRTGGEQRGRRFKRSAS